MVLKPETSHVSPQFYVVFDDEFSTVTFIREGITLPNWTYIVQHSSQSGAPENIELKDTWFTPDIKEYTRKTSSHETSGSKENNNNTFIS